MSAIEVKCAQLKRRLLYGDNCRTQGGYRFVVIRLGNFSFQRIYPAAWYGVSTLRGILAWARNASMHKYDSVHVAMEIYTVWEEQPTGNDILIAAFHHGEEVSL